MTQELEEQQRIAIELKEELQVLEMERQAITDKINVAEAKLEVHNLRNKVDVKKAIVSQLKSKLTELEEKLKTNINPQESSLIQEQPQEEPEQKPIEVPRKYF
jgi:predicted nuclease with TOPRIM domain